MSANRKTLSILFIVVTIFCGFTAQAETLSWNAVTTFTDGSAIAPATVTYTAYWTTESSLPPASLKPLASAISTTATMFNVTTCAMPRGTVIYFTCKATVGTVDSGLATARAWNVPLKAPSSPENVRMN